MKAGCMMRHSIPYILVLISALLISGCAVRHGDFTVISNKLVRLSDFKLDQSERHKGVTGKDTQRIIILFPTSGAPTVEGAVDDALEKGEGDVMTDAVIEYKWFYIPYIYGEAAWYVTGDVVKTRE